MEGIIPKHTTQEYEIGFISLNNDSTLSTIFQNRSMLRLLHFCHRGPTQHQSPILHY